MEDSRMGEFKPGMKVGFMHKNQFHNGVIEEVNRNTATIRKPMGSYNNDKIMRVPINKILVIRNDMEV